ncbi:Maf family nucleotide pyrophosphatase [Xiashengella succiniciproducens]|uniref:dTTP/UTP pyrophosphatase n=1 Tax=Xiashengella succiniciproducens TaxID=2949635 RepID=A0A9J6ZM79_9BACT|nr:Maf family nucleotide pyrophosphatase [Alkaliflexus sp. Ai-910]URW78771.1 Maf family nucleotide pyrophosphatase [Alkaliflexus sp. Ai-910]
MLANLKDHRIILASQSPRRQELLRMAEVDFEVAAIPGLEESFPDSLPAEQTAQYLARMKMEGYEEYWSQPKTLVITADTVVVLGDEVLGKPRDREDAIAMLSRLSGAVHTVFTGVAIRTAERQSSFTASTQVFFKELQERDIIDYVDRYRPFDKAGSYGVQEWIGLIGVGRIEGSFYNVMGLPVATLYEELRKF